MARKIVKQEGNGAVKRGVDAVADFVRKEYREKLDEIYKPKRVSKKKDVAIDGEDVDEKDIDEKGIDEKDVDEIDDLDDDDSEDIRKDEDPEM